LRRSVMLYVIRFASIGRIDDTTAAGTARIMPDAPVKPGNISREADKHVMKGSGTFKEVSHRLRCCPRANTH